MPSGAKKRKAAKRKQASNSNFAPLPSSTTHSQSGDDDLKHQDGRSSDGGDGEELDKREDSSSVRSFVTKGKSNQGGSTGNTNNEEGIDQIDWELKLEEDYESSNIAFGSKKKSDDGSSSGSSSSCRSSNSSDDESHVVEKNIVVVEDSPAIVDLVEPLDSFPLKVTQVIDDLVKPINPLSEGVTQVNESIVVGEADNLVAENPSVDKVLLEEVVNVIESISIENGSSSHVDESFLKENGMKKLPSLDKNTGISSIMMDLGSKSEYEEKAATSLGSLQSRGPSSDAKVSVATEIDANPTNGGSHVEESETPQYSDSQPLVASTPRIVQTTSWKSCCGIFELFAGSNK